MKKADVALVRFVQLALDDDHGISDAAMGALRELIDEVGGEATSHLVQLLRQVEATNGRNCLPVSD